jgi:hypothetical protein
MQPIASVHFKFTCTEYSPNERLFCNLHKLPFNIGCRDRVVRKLRVGRSGDQIQVGARYFRTRSDRPLGPTQHPVQWVTGLSQG